MLTFNDQLNFRPYCIKANSRTYFPFFPPSPRCIKPLEICNNYLKIDPHILITQNFAIHIVHSKRAKTGRMERSCILPAYCLLFINNSKGYHCICFPSNHHHFELCYNFEIFYLQYWNFWGKLPLIKPICSQ